MFDLCEKLFYGLIAERFNSRKPKKVEVNCYTSIRERHVKSNLANISRVIIDANRFTEN